VGRFERRLIIQPGNRQIAEAIDNQHYTFSVKIRQCKSLGGKIALSL
jgi:hypothetical protein